MLWISTIITTVNLIIFILLTFFIIKTNKYIQKQNKNNNHSNNNHNNNNQNNQNDNNNNNHNNDNKDQKNIEMMLLD